MAKSRGHGNSCHAIRCAGRRGRDGGDACLAGDISDNPLPGNFFLLLLAPAASLRNFSWVSPFLSRPRAGPSRVKRILLAVPLFSTFPAEIHPRFRHSRLQALSGVLGECVEAYNRCVANREKARCLLDRMHFLQPIIAELARNHDNGARRRASPSAAAYDTHHQAGGVCAAKRGRRQRPPRAITDETFCDR